MINFAFGVAAGLLLATMVQPALVFDFVKTQVAKVVAYFKR